MPDHHHHHHHHHWRDRSGYAHNAGAPGPGPNRFHLYRDKHNGMIAGVCAGVADYLGWDVAILRIGVIVLTLITFPMPVIAYFVAAVVIKPGRPSQQPLDREEERFWRTFTSRPKATFAELKHRFRALETRIGDLEAAVVSDEIGLRRAFADLEKGN